MTKQERVSYLVNLSTLITAQFKSPHNPTQALGDEFNKQWDALMQDLERDKDKHE